LKILLLGFLPAFCLQVPILKENFIDFTHVGRVRLILLLGLTNKDESTTFNYFINFNDDDVLDVLLDEDF
jgi:hypothetical protein